MPFCKTCGTYYPKSLGVCPKCNADELLLSAPEPEPLTQEEEKALRKRRWVGICIGIPAMIALIYLLYYIRMQFNG